MCQVLTPSCWEDKEAYHIINEPPFELEDLFLWQMKQEQYVIEFWTFIPLFLFFNMFNQCFQDASAQVTEGLVLKN